MNSLSGCTVSDISSLGIDSKHTEEHSFTSFLRILYFLSFKLIMPFFFFYIKINEKTYAVFPLGYLYQFAFSKFKKRFIHFIQLGFKEAPQAKPCGPFHPCWELLLMGLPDSVLNATVLLAGPSPSGFLGFTWNSQLCRREIF